MTRKSFSGNAVPTTLTSGISSTDMSIGVGATTGWPNTAVGPFIITVDRGQGTLEEKIEITSFTGGTLTVGTRGFDGTTAQGHSMGATAVCTIDADTINTHDAFVAAVGTVVPTTSAVGDSAVEGTSGKPADALHKHARESFDTGQISASAPGDTESDGTNLVPARSNHRHAREANPLGKPLALTGAVAPTRYVGGTTSGAPTAGTFAVGDFVIDQIGKIWICTGAGTPGTWAVPYPAQTNAAGHLASTYNLTTGTATFLTTASLAVGTWLVIFHGSVYGGSPANTIQVDAAIGSATATADGALSGELSGLAGVDSIDLAFLATITVAGTMIFQAIASGTSGTPAILATTVGNSFPNATGYTAVRVA